jgi:hypothetical protein
MQIDALDTIEEGEEKLNCLEDDARWQLAQRIVRSTTMRRATHLQKILLFVTETSLLYPDRLIPEQDIAQGVLGRKDDFDPAYDTIVRVQIGHLRQKLQVYFNTEGVAEPLRLTLPRGSYRPCFEVAAITKTVIADDIFVPSANVTLPAVDEAPVEMLPTSSLVRPQWLWAAAGILLLCAAVTLPWWKAHRTSQTDASSTALKMFPFLAKGGGRVAIVLPDTSLLLIQKTVNTEIPLEAYTQSLNSKNPAFQASDLKLQTALHLLGDVRTTTLDEASVGMDFMQSLIKVGLQGELRYARDLHIRDFGQGSYILIGNQRSDPWVTLFTGRNNFQFVGKPTGHYYVFRNMHPAPGELEEYAPVESPVEYTNYADITLTPNLTDSGYVLMIIGSDVPANEAAARFLMGSELPAKLEAILHQGNLGSLEILLRGHHLHGESNDKLAIVAYRMTNR